jgi:hypothetical protein
MLGSTIEECEHNDEEYYLITTELGSTIEECERMRI